MNSKSIKEKNLELQIDEKYFSLLDPAGLNGWQNMGFELELEEYSENFCAKKIDTDDKSLSQSGVYEESGIEATIEYQFGFNYTLIISKKLHNPGDKIVRIKNISCGIIDRTGEIHLEKAIPYDLRFCHMDNLRTEEYPRCRPEYPYVRNVPWETTFYGDKESQAVPCLQLMKADYSTILLSGQLEQNKARLKWQLGMSNSGNKIASYRLFWDFYNTSGICLMPGESICLEPVCLSIFSSSHPEKAINAFSTMLVKWNKWENRYNVLKEKAFYCSWNYGIARNITEASLLKTAKYIKENVPGIKHFLIDGGWVPWENGKGPHLGNFNRPESEPVYDHEKFPNGMKGVADKIRAAGLEPAIHWVPFVRLYTKLAKAHPEWLAKDKSGSIYTIGDYGYLDYSLPEVQEFLKHVFETIIVKWGFKAIKMDFWSQSVESSDIRFRTGSSIEWRDWLLATIHSYLPEDGFLMTCVATAMGNPFLGKSSQTYRACIDVGSAGWDEHKKASIWVQPMLALDETNGTLLNVDGLGVNESLTDDENIHRLTYGFITMGSLEIDGRLEELSSNHLEWVKKLCENIDRGFPVYSADEQAYTGHPLPKVLYVPYPQDSKTYKRGIKMHLALFNWDDEAQYVGVLKEKLELEGKIPMQNFWTGEEVEMDENGHCELLPPHSARLYEIKL